MDDRYIVSSMNEYLHQATGALAEWLNDMLPKVTENWWDECVLQKLSYNQRTFAAQKGFTKLTDFDLAALLRIADKVWYEMRSFAYLPTKERECIRDMQGVRNNWAHVGSELPGKDSIIRDLDILQRFFEQLNMSHDILSDVAELRKAVESPGYINKTSRAVDFVPAVEMTSARSQNISEKSLVYLVGNPSARGLVFSVEDLGEIKRYQVFIDGEIKTYYSDQIALVNDTPSYHWVSIETFQSYLSAYQINHPSAGNLYSLNSARIDFVPYQFRPALKLIKSDEPRILIADSVGVGKTIEAGLIIKELEARNELENIMIICPKPLVTERKWELEMKRFDEDFIPLDGATLRQILSDTDRDGEWPSRYNKTIVPYSILDNRVYSGEGGMKSKNYGLTDLDPAPHFDLVIIDEAHHIRNGSMEKEKAFAYKCVKYICDHADAVVMLTATPLQTGDDDLFTLLNLLRPDVVLDKATFNLMSKPNAYISQCAHVVRRADDDWQANALELLQGILTTQWGENVTAKNPLYELILEKLRQPEVSREERVKLITDIESLHSFNTMLNRTRRKDIQDFCIRRTHTLETEFTTEQQTLHDELLAFERTALSTLHNVRSVPFMMSTIRRQAASCIFGLAPHIRDLIDRRFAQINDDPEIDIDNFEFSGQAATSLESLATHVLELADNLPEEDPKFDSILSIIQQKQELENNKIILFSTFRYTLSYVKKKLAAAGLRVEQVDGSVKDDVRCEYRNRFELPKSDPSALDILLFTEVGSEGLDYQFCDMMINYDLPWNPMRIEQRIGRIDRRGQASEVVNIYNVITAGTVDADIYNRCLLRIGVFEQSIGECEEILGEIGRQVEQIAVDGKLTDQERRYKLEQMADNEIRKMQEMSKLEDEEKALFGFDLSNYTMAKEIREAENPWISPRSLQYLVEHYLKERLGKVNYIFGESDTKTLRLSAVDRGILLEDFRKLSGIRSALKRKWELYLKGKNPNHSITFEPEAAEKDRNAFFITAVHPLVKQAAMYYATNEVSYISLKYYSDHIPTGTYPFSIYAWNYIGLNPHFYIATVSDSEEITAEMTDILQTAQGVNFEGKVSSDMWSGLEAKQALMLRSARADHSADAKMTARYKLESIESNYRSRKRILEQQIGDAFEDNIRRMRQSELDSVTEWFEKKHNDIMQQAERADIYSTLIANGIITVERS